MIYLPLVVTAILLFNGSSAQRKEKNMQQELRVQLSVNAFSDHLEVEYSFENQLDHPILVFDRFWSMKLNSLDTNWAYVDLRGSRAAIKRTLDLMPQGLQHENPPVPYGREIIPKTKAGGKLSLPLPLHSHSEYQGMIPRQPAPSTEKVTQVGFALGWCPKPENLPSGIQPVTMNGETLYLLPYHLVAQLQRVSISEPVKLP